MNGSRVIAKTLAAAAALLICAVFLASAVSADPGAAVPVSAVVDDMSNSTAWSSITGGTVSAMRYNDETAQYSSGTGDTGYVAVRDYDAYIGVPVSISREFETPVNMYAYNALSFYINITPSEQLGGTDVAVATSYIVTVDVSSGTMRSSYSTSVRAGEWVHVSAEFGQWNMRSRITGLTISVTSDMSGGAATGARVRSNFRVDAVTMTSVRDTSFEERFLGTMITAEGATYTTSGPDGITVRRNGMSAMLNLGVCIPDRSGEYTADFIRVTVSDTSGSSLRLTYFYTDGEVTRTESINIPSTGLAAALYFPVDDIANLSNIYMIFDGRDAGDITVDSIEAVKSDAVTDVSVGSVDTCRMLADGSVNIRGQIPSDVVAGHINGSVAVYCVPVYGDISEYVFGADADGADGEEKVPYEPVEVIDVTTRFNVTLGADKLPTAYRAMRYVVCLVSGDEKLLIGQPRMADFSEEAGAKLPTPVQSTMGIYTQEMCSDASVILTDVSLDRLFGTATTGRLYSLGGSLFYFDNEYLAMLDEKIKAPSTCGASCYLRLVDDRDGASHAVTVSDETSFLRLYAAVDYLTSRYSSADYGFIRGVAIGESCVSDMYEGEDAARDAAASLAVAYGVGRANISGFRVILPIGNTVAGWERPNGADAEMMISGVSRELRSLGTMTYYLLAESAAPALMSDVISAQLALSGETAVSGQFIICEPLEGYALTGQQLMSDYIEKYYETCTRVSVAAFLYDIDDASVHDDERDAFMSALGYLDTDRYKTSLMYAFGERYESINAPESSHPLVRSVGRLVSSSDIAGRYSIYDFTDTFDSAGWFPVLASGECATVRVGGGERALRAAGGVGIMTSYLGGLDIKDAPILYVECYAENDGECEAVIYSSSGTYRTRLYLRGFSGAFYIDASPFAGLSDIYGIAILPVDDVGDMYISRVSLCSRTVGDDELAAMFAPTDEGGGDVEREGRLLEIMAVLLLSLALGVVVTAMLYRGRNRNIIDAKRVAENGKKRGARWTNTG